MTRSQQKAVRSLVKNECANYDHEYGCLPFDCPCPVLNKPDRLCRYFRNAVLPLDPTLEAANLDLLVTIAIGWIGLVSEKCEESETIPKNV